MNVPLAKAKGKFVAYRIAMDSDDQQAVNIVDLRDATYERDVVGRILDAIKERFRSSKGDRPLSELHLDARQLTRNDWKRLKNVAREGRVVDLVIHHLNFETAGKNFKLMKIQERRKAAAREV